MLRPLAPLLLILALAAVPTAHADMAQGRAAFAAGKYDQAFKEFVKAGDKGDLTALYLAGEMQLQGRGAPKDAKAALKLMRRAAEGGHVAAMSALGAVYAYGQDVPADYEQALRWLRPAAEADDMHAQNNLATLLYFGLGTEKDIVSALYWARRAAGKNLVAAVKLAAEIAAQATPEQASAANAMLASGQRPKPPQSTTPLAREVSPPPKPPEPAAAEAPHAVEAPPPPPPPPAVEVADSPTPLPPPPAAGQDWAVQVGSLPSRGEAEKHWAGLTKRHADLLAGRTPLLREADVAGKGRYTRVLLGGFDKAGAASFCTTLKAAGADCLTRRLGVD
ncbi:MULTISPECIES: SPOR domain-containing protein [unclassified Azospirillum]|uniref:SPOR domain-containing protein n=1 Tax=unclassified Azospirillum TaxID=2630922 RepID=UPI000B74EE10|nr:MULTISPECIES: SPOR domain-containing protein [unclassified Azospirillum]SNT00567.1 Sel1 repeat-containing protein [Azospirillum sp. RU38E]SNT16515.1 Sel1 repeat-containing protein [Azospirillum sp. RU37A]